MSWAVAGARRERARMWAASLWSDSSARRLASSVITALDHRWHGSWHPKLSSGRADQGSDVALSIVTESRRAFQATLLKNGKRLNRPPGPVPGRLRALILLIDFRPCAVARQAPVSCPDPLDFQVVTWTRGLRKHPRSVRMASAAFATVHVSR